MAQGQVVSKRHIIHNKEGKTATIVFYANADNLSNTFHLANTATGGETVTALNIRQIWWGSNGATAHWHVDRGGVTNTVAILNGSGHINYAAMSNPLTLYSDQPIIVTASTGIEGYIMLEVSKQSDSEYPAQGS